MVAAGAAGAAFGSSALPGTTPHASAAVGGGKIRSKPNIVLIITDQERRPQHWPEGWGRDNLPHRQRLIDSGLSFNFASCNTAMCSPSRSSLFTGMYPSQHGVTRTLTADGALSPDEPTLKPSTPNMASLLASAGYDVHYRGKWHISKGKDGGDPTTADLESFGFKGWVPPEAGQDIKPENFAGGYANHDQRYADEAVAFVNSVDPNSDTPFALVASFANPHDILAYPNSWDTPTKDGTNNYGADAPGCFEMGIDLPPTFNEVLALNHKPRAQTQLNVASNVGLGPLRSEEEARNYCNLYAFMQQEVDAHIGAVIDAIEKKGLREETIIIHIADHGEMGMSHGGMRQKAFNAYEETLLVPMVISNPRLFSQGKTTDAMSTLIDLMPTLATIADVPADALTNYDFKGKDLSPIIEDAAASKGAPTVEVQDVIHFTFDDWSVGQPDSQDTITQPNHLRTIRERGRKLSMYYDPDWVEPPVFEMYDLVADPLELNNLAAPSAPFKFRADMLAEMLPRLIEVMAEKGTTPAGMPETLPLPSSSLGSVGS